GAVGARSADNGLLARPVPREEGMEAREEAVEERRLRRLRQVRERARIPFGDLETDAAGSKAAPRPSRTIRREIERRDVQELAPPVVELTAQLTALEPGPVPRGPVGVVEGGLGEKALAPFGEGAIELRHLAHEQIHRPAVGDDVVKDEGQDVLLLPDANEPGPPERALREIEGGLGLGPET